MQDNNIKDDNNSVGNNSAVDNSDNNSIGNNSDDNNVLCVANSYLEKFYLNPRYSHLPKEVQQQLQIICVSYTEDIGGIIEMLFDEEGKLMLRSIANDTDYLYDEIGSATKIREISDDYGELFQKLELYHMALDTLGEEGMQAIVGK